MTKLFDQGEEFDRVVFNTALLVLQALNLLFQPDQLTVYVLKSAEVEFCWG